MARGGHSFTLGVSVFWVIKINLEDIFVISSSCYYYCCIDLQHQWFYCIRQYPHHQTPDTSSLGSPFSNHLFKSKKKNTKPPHPPKKTHKKTATNPKPNKITKNPHKTYSLYCTSHTSLCIYIYIYLNMLQFKKKVYGILLDISLRSWWNHRCLKKSSIPQNKVKLN